MRLTSPAFGHNAPLPSHFTCDGADVSPPLVIEGVQPAAKSLALIVDDPDAPAGTFVHWTIWNIAPTITTIAENSVPSGATEGQTNFGSVGWGGPCPPNGTHRYFFKLYALDTVLDLPAATDAAGLRVALEGHILEQAELIGLYQRTK